MSAAFLSVPAFSATWKTTWKLTSIWAAISALIILVNAVGYADNYPDVTSRAKLVESMGVNGITLLFGPASHVGTVDGFTEWRLMLLATILSVWAIIVGTRATRGAEDHGRWQALLLGRTSKRAVLTGTCLALLAGLFLVSAAITFATIIAQAATDSTVLYGPAVAVGLAVVGPVAVFEMVAVLLSQFLASRSSALNTSLAILAIAYVLRAVGDVQGSDAAWISPLTWTERMTPLTTLNLLPLFLAGIATIAAYLGAIVVIPRRDVGEGFLNITPRNHKTSATPRGITWTHTMTTLRNAAGWGIGIGVIGCGCALVADQGADLANTSSQIAQILGENGIDGYLSLVFLAIGTILALFAATQVGAVVAAENDGRIPALLTAGLGRAKYWTLISLAGLAGIFLCSLIVMLCTWGGLSTQDDSLAFFEVFKSMFMWVPLSWMLFGIGMLVFGWWPYMAVSSVYTILGGGLLIDLVGTLIGVPEIILGFSPWYYVPRVPLEDGSSSTLVVFSVIAVLTLACGFIGWQSRDTR